MIVGTLFYAYFTFSSGQNPDAVCEIETMPQCVAFNCTNASGVTKGVPFHR